MARASLAASCHESAPLCFTIDWSLSLLDANFLGDARPIGGASSAALLRLECMGFQFDHEVTLQAGEIEGQIDKELIPATSRRIGVPVRAPSNWEWRAVQLGLLRTTGSRKSK